MTRLQHLTLAVRGRRALARDEGERRALVRALVSTGSKRLLLVCLVDDHLHAAVRAKQPGYLARDLRRRIRTARPDLELKQSHLEPVDTRAHLRWLVRYLLQQPAKHGLAGPPALWTGSCFQDLVGARLLEGFDATGLREELPRLRMRELFGVVGLEPVRLEPASDAALRRAGAGRLVELAAGVFAVGPEIAVGTRSKGVEAARSLAARAGAAAGVAAVELAHFLGVQPRAVRHLAARAGSPRELHALRLRLALEERARSARSR